MANPATARRPPPAKGAGGRKSSLRGTVKDQSGAGKVRIGDMLRKEGYITATQLNHALDEQKKSSRRLGGILVKLGYIEEETILNVLSRIHGFPAVDLTREKPTPEVLEIMPYEVAKKYTAFPLRVTSQNKTLQVTMAEPTDMAMVEAMQVEIKKGLSVCVSTENDIVEAYKKHYKISEEEYKSFLADDGLHIKYFPRIFCE